MKVLGRKGVMELGNKGVKSYVFECRGCILVNSSVGETLQPDKGELVSLLLQKPKAEPLNSITP